MSSWRTLSWAFEFSRIWNCPWTLLFWANKLHHPTPLPTPTAGFDNLLCRLHSEGFAAEAKPPDVGDMKRLTVLVIWKLYELFHHCDSSSMIEGFVVDVLQMPFKSGIWRRSKGGQPSNSEIRGKSCLQVSSSLHIPDSEQVALLPTQ